MVTFTKEEIIPSTKLTRNLSEILNKIKKHTLEKVVVLRNNEMDAVIISYDEYEQMKETLEIMEYREIYETVKKRNETNAEYKTFDEILSNIGVNYNDI